ncbi:MAG: hypothetical protein OEZ06_28720 [Myxococcales bacterium]|nr:hypothetical protein [Myxococcales bacterium]
MPTGRLLVMLSLWSAASVLGCADSNEPEDEVTSTTQWQSCSIDADCAQLAGAVACAGGRCVDAAGAPVARNAEVIDNSGGEAGGSSDPGAAGGSGGSGGSGGTAGGAGSGNVDPATGGDRATLEEAILAEVDALGSCEQAADCTSVTLPFSCDSHFLNASADRSELDALIERYSSTSQSGLACTLACRCGELACEAGKCAGVESDCMSPTTVCL